MTLKTAMEMTADYTDYADCAEEGLGHLSRILGWLTQWVRQRDFWLGKPNRSSSASSAFSAFSAVFSIAVF